MVDRIVIKRPDDGHGHMRSWLSFRPSRRRAARAGIHNPKSWLWIPGSPRSLSSGRASRGSVGGAPE
jgi:hypothetical protein